MDFFLPSPRAPAPSPRPAWLSTLGWCIAGVASIALAAASMPAAGWESTFSSLAPEARLQRPAGSAASRGPGADDANLRNMARCPTCGIVVNVRTLPLAGATTVVYELTVRFRDGSRRLSNHSDDATWRVGDSIMLMGGTRLADRN